MNETGANETTASTSPDAFLVGSGNGVQRALAELGRVGVVALQLGLVLAVVYLFQIESRTFFQVMALGSAGFVVHALLPLRYRQPFFVALSFGAILLAFGLIDGAVLIAFGLAMIGMCHLPIRLGWRVLLLLGTGAVFALWRMELIPAGWSVAIWPILASMFMFRIAIYLHALQHEEKRPEGSRTLAYFFMLPNVCFPLFPVVDYSTFRRTYFDADAWRIYQTGMKWIVRGLVHLLLYRVVYVHFASDPMHVQSLGDLTQFLLATFFLYLRVSGQFHLITGILHLYGYRLPETHHLYFLASSFTDFWRRINIYWKDFMMKLVYYPSFFWLRRWGATTGLVLATLVVFLATWLLHSYQWFWLRGGFPITAQDGLFWGFLGLLVVFGSLREMRRSRLKKANKAVTWSMSVALRTVGTFTAICVLWSLWSSESLTVWLLMWQGATQASMRELLALAALLLVGVLIAGKNWDSGEAGKNGGGAPVWKGAAASAIVLVLLIAIGSPDLYRTDAPKVAGFIDSIRVSTLNARDAALQHKGYYENLDNTSRMSAQLWDVQAAKPAHWVALGATSAYRHRNDFLGGELKPNSRIVFLDKPLSTNAFGMRDRERQVQKPAGTYRIAVLGPSHVMGSGVGDDETFTRYLEERLNAARPAGADVRFEVLNFGVAAYSLTQQLAIFEDRVRRFQPDAVFVTDSARMAQPVVGHLLEAVAKGWPIPSPALAAEVDALGIAPLANDGIPVPFDSMRQLFSSLGIATRMPWAEAERRTLQAADRLVAKALEELAARVRASGAIPVLVALDNVVPPPDRQMPELRMASQAGFLIFDLFGMWQGHDMSALRIAPWDNHPNARGNQMIAEQLQGLIERHRNDLNLPVR